MAATKGLIVGGVVLAAAAGFAGGYLFAMGRLTQKFDEKLAEELAEAGRVYRIVQQRQEHGTVEEAAEAYAKKDAELAMEAYLPNTVTKEPPPVYERARTWTPGFTPGEVPPIRRNNIFDDAKPDEGVDFDYAEEERKRTEEAPYIVSLQEHQDNEHRFNQVTLTYYEGDGILCDNRDDRIDNLDEMVGEDNIVRFGHRSNDDNVVYVRNHHFGLDMEIVRDRRKYAEVVLGFVQDE